MLEWAGSRAGRVPSAAAQRRLDALTVHLAAGAGEPEPTVAKDAEPGPVPAPAPGRHLATPVRRSHRVSAAVGHRLPARARDLTGSGTVSSHHVGVLAVVLAAALALSVWWLVAGRAETEPVPAPAPAVPLVPSEGIPSASVPVPTASAPASAGPSDDGLVVVDVAGKVRRPGIVTLPAGSRVVDALEAAGGARDSVDLTSLNLARELVDGEQLLVGLAPPPGAPPPSGPPAPSATGLVGPVNLNTADMAELETLPGVGPVTAQAILDWRAANGSFTSVDELLEVDGIGEATLADLRDLVTV